MNKAERNTAHVRELRHFINGKAVTGTSGRFGDVFDPAHGQVTARELT